MLDQMSIEVEFINNVAAMHYRCMGLPLECDQAGWALARLFVEFICCGVRPSQLLEFLRGIWRKHLHLDVLLRFWCRLQQVWSLNSIDDCGFIQFGLKRMMQFWRGRT